MNLGKPEQAWKLRNLLNFDKKILDLVNSGVLRHPQALNLINSVNVVNSFLNLLNSKPGDVRAGLESGKFTKNTKFQ